MAAVSGSTTQVPEMDPSEILSLLFSPMAMQSFVFPLINYLAGIAVLLYDVITFFIAMANGQGSTFKPLGTQMVQQFITGTPQPFLQRGNRSQQAATSNFLGLHPLEQARSDDSLLNILNSLSAATAKFAGDQRRDS